jgi:hypothetical protein|tara:strand:- start:267 stop:476 length:210 start_codon:yes stop_codon:yes gene_type:complete
MGTKIITFFGIFLMLMALPFTIFGEIIIPIILGVSGAIVMYFGEISKRKSDKKDAEHIKENKDELLEKF